MRALLLAAMGCGSTPDVAPADRPPVVVQSALERPPEAGGGVLVVRTEYDRTMEIDLPTPVGSGLEFESAEAPEVETLGQRNVVTQRFRFSGSPGHYEIQPVTVTYPGPDGADETAKSDAIFLDLQSRPILVGELADIEAPGPAGSGFPWLVLGGLVVAGGLAVAFWPRRTREVIVRRPPLPPHLAALQAWEAIRADAERSDEDKARELSVIFRRYVEAVLRFEATALTTSEILARLGELARLPAGNVPRAKRLLRATDRVKFAEERPTEDLIDELDSDLRAFVTDTRPPPGPAVAPRTA